MEFETQIMDISDEALDGLFDETPQGTPNAESLLGAKKEAKTKESADTDPEEKEKAAIKTKTEKATKEAIQQSSIEDLDLEDFEEEEEEEDTTTKKKAAAKRTPAKKVEVIEEEEDAEEDDEEEEEVEDKKKTKTTKSKEAPAEEEEASPEVSGVLKSTVDYLINQGIWQDFEGREDLDITEEVYAKLVAQQDALRVSGMFEELVDSTGPFGKAIIEYVKNGGSPDEIIDLFKEQKQVESIPLDSADGQKEMVKHYYTEVLGWKAERVEKYISNLVISNELESESKEVKELFGSYYKKEADRLNKEQDEYVSKQKEAEQAFASNIKSTIKERKDLSTIEKKTVEDYLLNYDQRLPNGNLVNKFYVNFAKMQANPQDYVDLVMFVMDKQKFMKKVSTQEQTKAAAEAFKFIKGNGAVSTKKGSSYDQATRTKEKKVVSLDWGLPTKNN